MNQDSLNLLSARHRTPKTTEKRGPFTPFISIEQVLAFEADKPET